MHGPLSTYTTIGLEFFLIFFQARAWTSISLEFFFQAHAF